MGRARQRSRSRVCAGRRALRAIAGGARFRVVVGGELGEITAMNFPRPLHARSRLQFRRLLAGFLGLIAGGGMIAPLKAATIDKYGNVRITTQDMGDASYSQFRRDAASWQNRLNSGNVGEAMRARLEREQREKDAADERREAMSRRNEEAGRRNDAYIASVRAESKAKEEAARQRTVAAIAERDRKFNAEVRASAASILTAVREDTSIVRGHSGREVAGLGEGFITGSFRGESLVDLGINREGKERYETALLLFSKSFGHFGHEENHRWRSGSGPLASATDLIGPAAYLMGGKGKVILEHYRQKTDLVGADKWPEVLALLTCALAMPKSDLDPKQQEQAVSLAAGLIGRISGLQGHDGAALACMIVAAAQRTPELWRVPGMHEQFVPFVRASVWNHGFKSLPAPVANGAPLLGSQVAIPGWNLAAMIVMAEETRLPLNWFGHLRLERARKHLPPISAADKVTLQWALDGWFARSGVSSGVRRAIQADCDFACEADEAACAESITADAKVDWYIKNVAFDAKWRALAVGQLLDPAVEAHLGLRAYLASSPQHIGLVAAFIAEACAESPERSMRVLTAVRRLTAIDDAVEFPAIARVQWETLVKLGENFVTAGDKAWLEPSASARLARLRRERLRDEAGAARWLAEPRHQPSDREAPEKWREWATLAGGPGIRIAAQRHPEHWTEPASLRSTLNALAGTVRDVLSPEAHRTVKALLAHADNITDPETVLAIAQVRGPLLGDWAKLGAWLADPRRGPKDKSDPLHPLFVIAIIERDQAAGHLADNWFTSAKNAVACERFEKWLEQVLAAKGGAQKKLIEENFPAVIYCEGAASAYPDLRMLGYDAARGGFASRALLLLSTAEFNPENLLMAGVSEVELDDGTVIRRSLYDVEPWLEAVAKLPRAVPAEALLAQLTAGVQARLDWQAKVAALPRREVFPGRSKEENEKLNAVESPAEKALSEDERRSGWVAGGCQQALARLAERWSPVRESAQAAILARGDQLVLDQDDLLVHAPGIAARVKWEQSKMRGLDDADAFAVASAGLSDKDLRIMAKLAGGEGWLRPLVLWQDEGFVAAAKAAASMAAR